MAGDVRRVLLYRLGSLGDHLVALPSYRLVERAFPGAERRMLTNFPVHAKAPAAAVILEGTGLVQGYFRYAVGTRNPLVLLRLWWELRSWKPDVLVYLGSARGLKSAERDAWFFRMCGIGRQVGVPLTEDMQQNRPLVDEAGEFQEFEADRLARNLAELGDARTSDAAAWNLGLTSAERAQAREVLAPAAGRPMLAVSVGTKVQAKDWGVDNWRALLQQLGARYPGYALVLAGAAEEKPASDLAAEGWRVGAGADAVVVNLCGLLTPRESAACFARAEVFVGHDSGPMHLAAAVGTRCVAVFAARNIPRVWFPHGSGHSGLGHRVVYHHVSCAGCGLETCLVERKRCLTSITVSEVEAEVGAVLG